VASPGAASFRSLADLWAWRVGSTPHAAAMRWRERGAWRGLTWFEADVRVRRIAAGLRADGLATGDRVGLCATTSVGWVLVDLGTLLAGGVTTSMHTTSPIDDQQFILEDAGAAVVFVDSVERAHAFLASVPTLRRVVVIEPSDGAVLDHAAITTLASLEASGAAWIAEHPDALDALRKTLQPSDLATLIYTSGTTGRPKGVELTHDAWVYEAEAIDRLGVVNAADRQLLYLPLAHVFARAMEITFIRLGVPTAIDGNVDRLLHNLSEVRPTWLATVPRTLEKAYDAILREAEASGPWKKALFDWAIGVGRQMSQATLAGRAPAPWLVPQHRLAERWVLERIRSKFGGDLRFLISGGAPLSKDIARFFHAIGIVVCEGYGLTESSAASTVNTPEALVFGSVGRPLPGCEVKIADDGEILLKSRGVMRGYRGLPEATAEALTPDGWLHTGDIGRILSTGHVEITDRKKELIVTAGGRNVAPAMIAERLKARSPLIQQVLVHGDRRPFLSCLLTLEVDAVRAWADREGVRTASWEELALHPQLRHFVQQAVEDVNRTLPAWEQVRRFAVLPEDFTPDNGLLTPTLKPRRAAIEARYADRIEAFYDGQRRVGR
jgi:long-chain acyl-CoA synthetase